MSDLPVSFLPAADQLALIIDVLRANDLHQEHCRHLGIVRANRYGGVYYVDQPCNCWLSQPAPPPALDASDLRVDVDYGSTAVRITHLPTGITVTADGRSQIQAKAHVLHELAVLVASRAASPDQP